MYGLNPSEERTQEEIVRSHPYDPAIGTAPGFFEGSGTAAVKGLGESFAQVADLAENELEHFANIFNTPMDAILGTHLNEQWDKYAPDFRNAEREFRPDPKVTGYLGNVLYGLTSVAPQATAGFALAGPVGAAALVGTAQGRGAMNRAIEEGVDPNTAVGVGAIEGASQAAGILLPGGVGGTLLKKVASGAAINTAMGATQRGATGVLLRANGYDAMAEQYRVLDGAALLTDIILGGGFGAMHDGKLADKARDPLPSDVDLALAGNDMHGLELDSAPGIPSDLETRASHVEAMNRATEQMMRGEAVDVSGALRETNFVSRSFDPDAVGQIRPLLEERGYSDILQATDKVIEYRNRVEEASKTVSDLQAAIENAKTDVGRWTLVDPVTAERLQGIEAELSSKGLSRKRRALLEDERRTIVEGSNIDSEVKQALLETGNKKRTSEIVLEKLQKRLVASEREFRRTIKELPDDMRSLYEEQPKQNAPLERPQREGGFEQPKRILGAEEQQVTKNADSGTPTEQGTPVENIPDMEVPQSIEGDAIIKTTAKDAVAEADARVSQAEADAKLFDVAINCFLGHGS